MPIYKVQITRTYQESEGFTRYISADNASHARELGNLLGGDCDDDCPDDCAVIDDSYDNTDAYFRTDEVEAVTEAPEGVEVLTEADCDTDHEPEEPEDDTPCLDTSFHDHEMDVD